MEENNLKAKLVEDIADVLDNRNYPFSTAALRDIVYEWFDAKKDLLDLFSNHPKWNQDKLMIQFDEDYSRKIDKLAINRFANWSYRWIVGESVAKAEWVKQFIFEVEEEFLSPKYDTLIENINMCNPNYKLRNNMKTSKAVGKIFREEGWDKLFEDFNKHYAAYCDAISPIKTIRHTCISLNPVDYLLMSHGNSWSSCHDIDEFYDDPGCYSSGTISYMLDDVSFVFYTVDAAYNGREIEKEPKICRQIFAYQNGQLFQSRLYPQSNDSGAEHIYSELRAIVQKVVADCENKPNLWKKLNDIDELREVVRSGDGATCYPDWEYYTTVTLSTLNALVEEDIEEMYIGACPICVECGGFHDSEDCITCCTSPRVRRCMDCGNIIYDEDDIIWVNGAPYCNDCAFECEKCGRSELRSYEYTVKVSYRFGSYGESWCERCASDYATCCDECGDYWFCDDVCEVDGYVYCPDCLDEETFVCDECGERHRKSNKFEYEDMELCETCFDFIQEESDEEEEESVQAIA